MDTRVVVLAAACLWLTACVPASLHDWAGGHEDAHDAPIGDTAGDGSSPSASADGGPAGLDASARSDVSHELDAFVRADANANSAADATGPDARRGDVADTGTAPLHDAAASPGFLCKSTDALCDDFEGTPLSCENDHVNPWSWCETLGSAPDAVVLAGPAPRNHSLFSSVGADTEERSTRLAFDLPTDTKTVHAEFDFYPQAGNNNLYTFMKLEQSAGHDANGDPTHFPGVSLVARQGSLALVIQTASDLSKPDTETAVDVRSLPSAWTRVAMDVTFGTQINVTLAFDQQASLALGPFTRGTATIDDLVFLLGVYTDVDGSAAVLFDNVSLHL